MIPPGPSFADEFNAPHKYALLVCDVRRAVASLLFQVRHFKMLVEAGLVAFSSACFEFSDEVREEVQNGSVAHLQKVFLSHLYGLSKIAGVGFCA